NSFWRQLSDVAKFSDRQRTGISFGGGARRDGSGAINFITNDSAASINIPHIKSFFKSVGANLDEPGKALFFNDRLGRMMVRATLPELDAIEKAVKHLNTDRQHLTIRVKALEVELTPQRSLESLYPRKISSTNMIGGERSVTAILSDDEMRALIRDMERMGGTDMLSCPEVTTMSGRQAQIKVVDMRQIVTRLDVKTNSVTGESDMVPITEWFEIGPVVDVVPYVAPDRQSIQMAILPSLREFLGYDDPKDIPDRELMAVGGLSETRARPPTPLPKFRLRQLATTARVFDGQTIMLAGGKSRERVKEEGKSSTNFVEKALFFFITPRLVEPDGNPIHSDEELRSLHKSVPEQTPAIRN
ncbi:MAG TPA: hypothetical protein VK530_12660, partial [Candidatus Acidoferrum sp.]|nr:hypothetical protein [Candidatus Acidoferrum sp.]